MPRLRPTVLLSALSVLCFVDASHGLEQASGVNMTADEGFGARHLGMALTRAGFGRGAETAVNAPASMNDVNDFTFTTAHAERFGMARFDNLALIVPWHEQTTLGFGVARYSVTGIEHRIETAGNPYAEPDGLFDASDWMITGSLARRYGPIDVGGSVHILRRQLDQGGLGMRGDAMAQYTFDGRLRAGAHVRGLVPSMARWESGHSEYEAPEAVLFLAMRRELPYFYGTLQAGFETPGILQPGARSSGSLEGERGLTDPLSVLKTSKAGAEFEFDFGLSLRAGFDEIAPGAWASSARLGMGYDWRGILAVDYAFAAHPYLGESHRVALRFTPAFPRFEGRGFRPGATVSVPADRMRATYPAPYVPGETGAPIDPQEAAPSEGVPQAPPPHFEVLEEELEEGEMLEH